MKNKISEDIDEFNQKYNKDLISIIENEKLSGSTDKIKLPGTICGDERMYKQFNRYLEIDNKNQTNSSFSIYEKNSRKRTTSSICI